MFNEFSRNVYNKKLLRRFLRKRKLLSRLIGKRKTSHNANLFAGYIKYNKYTAQKFEFSFLKAQKKLSFFHNFPLEYNLDGYNKFLRLKLQRNKS
jgi:hypothetical protein